MDVAILEVGIGGLHDATNVIMHPVVCAITHLGKRHVDPGSQARKGNEGLGTNKPLDNGKRLTMDRM